MADWTQELQIPIYYLELSQDAIAFYVIPNCVAHKPVPISSHICVGSIVKIDPPSLREIIFEKPYECDDCMARGVRFPLIQQVLSGPIVRKRVVGKNGDWRYRIGPMSMEQSTLECSLVKYQILTDRAVQRALPIENSRFELSLVVFARNQRVLL